MQCNMQVCSPQTAMSYNQAFRAHIAVHRHLKWQRRKKNIFSDELSLLWVIPTEPSA